MQNEPKHNGAAWCAPLAIIAFICTILAGCAAARAPALAQADQSVDQFVGQKRWVSAVSPIYLWAGPPKAGDVMGVPPGLPVKSGAFTVERVVPGILKGYWIRFDDGREGYTNDNLILTDDATEHARKVGEAKTCARKGGVAVGMTREQVYGSCWGKPQKVNLTRTSNGDHEQWVYAGSNYVYLTNGVVTSIQTSR